MEREIRRCRNTLTITGNGILIFALYTICKSLYYMINIYNSNYGDLFLEIPVQYQEMFRHLFLIILAVVFLIDFGIRCFVSLSARAEGKGKRKGKGYLFAAGILLIIHASSIIFDFMTFEPKMIVETVVSVIVELTSVLIVLDLIRTSLTLKKLTAQKE